jgi:hypothetical protein
MADVFASKIDTWLIVVLAASVLLTAVVVPMALVHAGGGERVVLLIGLLVGVGLPLWVMLATDYTVRGDSLVIRSGPFRWVVPLRDVTHIVPTRSPWSSPALSLDRLRIEYGRRSIMVSPRDKQAFVDAVAARCPAIRM